MAKHIKPLTLTEVEYVALSIRIREDAKATADMQFEQRMDVFRRQFEIAPNVPLQFEAAVGPVPARLVYESPDPLDALDREVRNTQDILVPD